MGKDTTHKTSATISLSKLAKSWNVCESKSQLYFSQFSDIYASYRNNIKHTAVQTYAQCEPIPITITANGESLKLLTILSLKHFSVQISL